MNKASFEALSPAVQKILVDTAREMAHFQWKTNEDSEATSLAQLKAEGMQVVETVDREAFRRIVADEVRRDFVQKFGPELPAMIDTAGT